MSLKVQSVGTWTRLVTLFCTASWIHSNLPALCFAFPTSCFIASWRADNESVCKYRSTSEFFRTCMQCLINKESAKVIVSACSSLSHGDRETFLCVRLQPSTKAPPSKCIPQLVDRLCCWLLDRSASLEFLKSSIGLMSFTFRILGLELQALCSMPPFHASIQQTSPTSVRLHQLFWHVATQLLHWVRNIWSIVRQVQANSNNGSKSKCISSWQGIQKVFSQHWLIARHQLTPCLPKCSSKAFTRLLALVRGISAVPLSIFLILRFKKEIDVPLSPSSPKLIVKRYWNFFNTTSFQYCVSPAYPWCHSHCDIGKVKLAISFSETDTKDTSDKHPNTVLASSSELWSLPLSSFTFTAFSCKTIKNASFTSKLARV